MKIYTVNYLEKSTTDNKKGDLRSAILSDNLRIHLVSIPPPPRPNVVVKEVLINRELSGVVSCRDA